MANISTVTRPYAKAILALSKQENSYTKWSNILQVLAFIAQDKLGYKVLSNLAMTPAQKVQFIESVLGDGLDTEAKNLIKILAHVKRLLILPELQKMFEAMHNVDEGLVMVDLTLASPIDQDEFKQIADLCNKIFDGKAVLSEEINSELIGGGLAQIGNRVIDASIAGRLISLRNLLRN